MSKMSDTEVETTDVTVAELTPRSKHVNLTVKVVELGEEREVTSRNDGNTHRVTEATVGDSTGVVVLTLWDDAIDMVEKDHTYRINNGYVNLFKGNIRLNVGKYGELTASDEEIEEVNLENNVSEEEYEQPRRFSRRRFSSSYGGGYNSDTPSWKRNNRRHSRSGGYRRR